MCESWEKPDVANNGLDLWICEQRMEEDDGFSIKGKPISDEILFEWMQPSRVVG